MWLMFFFLGSLVWREKVDNYFLLRVFSLFKWVLYIGDIVMIVDYCYFLKNRNKLVLYSGVR